MIAYKVVTKDTRRSVVHHTLGVEGLQYDVGKKVKPLEGTPGIYTFLHKKDAEAFITEYNHTNFCTIIRVRPLGRGNRQAEYLPQGSSLREFLHSPLSTLLGWVPAPKGTVVFKDGVIPIT